VAKRSAGILLHRHREDRLEVLLVHMGGPLWARKDDGAWSIPKGEYTEAEDPLDAARREFAEELGVPVPDGRSTALGEVKQSGGKVVTAWAVEADLDVSAVVSNTFTMEWPRGSGRLADFPEIDRAEWCSIDTARRLLVRAQVEFLDRLLGAVNSG
jgi:predicted NUDIX family NTP pyrophosphohydrolase